MLVIQPWELSQNQKSLEELTDQAITTTSSAGPSSTSGSGSSCLSDGDSSHLFVSTMRSILPDDISRCRDDKPTQPQLRNFQKSRDGDRNRSFAVHWYKSYPFIEYSIQRDAVYCFCCRMFPSHSCFVDTTFTAEGCSRWKKIGHMAPSDEMF